MRCLTASHVRDTTTAVQILRVETVVHPTLDFTGAGDSGDVHASKRFDRVSARMLLSQHTKPVAHGPKVAHVAQDAGRLFCFAVGLRRVLSYALTTTQRKTRPFSEPLSSLVAEQMK